MAGGSALVFIHPSLIGWVPEIPLDLLVKCEWPVFLGWVGPFHWECSMRLFCCCLRLMSALHSSSLAFCAPGRGI